MKQSIKTLEAHNEWRRGGGRECVQTEDIGRAIDDCIQAAKRYELVRTLNGNEFDQLINRNIYNGENFDNMIDELIKARS